MNLIECFALNPWKNSCRVSARTLDEIIERVLKGNSVIIPRRIPGRILEEAAILEDASGVVLENIPGNKIGWNLCVNLEMNQNRIKYP